MRARTVCGPLSGYVQVDDALDVTEPRPATVPSQAYRYVNPAVLSTDDGSNWTVNDPVTGLPSFTGPLLPSDAVGATFATATAKLFVSDPESLSVTTTV